MIACIQFKSFQKLNKIGLSPFESTKIENKSIIYECIRFKNSCKRFQIALPQITIFKLAKI
jgi:hypothetical protein